MIQIDLQMYSYCLGTSLTIEALKHAPKEVVKVVVSSKVNRNEQYLYLKELCIENNVEIIEDDYFIEKYSLKENCYAIGIFKKFKRELRDSKQIVLYKFNDFGQIGTILRSGVSFDFKDFVLIDSDVDIFDPRLVRASMGSIFHANIKKYSSLDDYLNENKNNLYCFSNAKGNELNCLKPVEPYALLLQENEKLDNFETYYVKHHGDNLSLSALSSIVFNYCFEKRKR